MKQKIPSISKLRTICQPQHIRARHLHLIVCSFFRSFSIYLTWLLLHTKVTPNQVTVFGISLVILAPFLFLLGDYSWTIVGVVLYVFGYALDYCDGEIARYRKTGGKVGLWFVEPATHDIQYGLTTIPMGLAAYLMTGNVWMIILGFSGSLAKLLTRALESRFQIMKLLRKEYLFLQGNKKIWEKKKSDMQTHKAFYAKVYETFYTTASFGVLVPLAALTGRFDIFTWFYGVTLTLIFLVYLVRLFYKMRPYVTESI